MRRSGLGRFLSENRDSLKREPVAGCMEYENTRPGALRDARPADAVGIAGAKFSGVCSCLWAPAPETKTRLAPRRDRAPGPALLQPGALLPLLGQIHDAAALEHINGRVGPAAELPRAPGCPPQGGTGREDVGVTGLQQLTAHRLSPDARGIGWVPAVSYTIQLSTNWRYTVWK